VALAARLGIAPRRLWGWEPRTFTTVHRDGDGQVVGEVSELEPEFDDEQRNWLVAYQMHLDGLDPNGFPIGEATSIEADPATREGAFKFVADEEPTVNYAEKARLDAADAYRKKYGDKVNLNGMSWSVQKVVRAER